MCVNQNEPFKKRGVYWGYSVRVASTIQAVFDESPYKKGYDLKLGVANKIWDPSNLNLAKFDGFKHGLIFFSGLEGIKGLIEADETLSLNANNFYTLFDFYLDDPQIE